jgi:hypothetical protein
MQQVAPCTHSSHSLPSRFTHSLSDTDNYSRCSGAESGSHSLYYLSCLPRTVVIVCSERIRFRNRVRDGATLRITPGLCVPSCGPVIVIGEPRVCEVEHVMTTSRPRNFFTFA